MPTISPGSSTSSPGAGGRWASPKLGPSPMARSLSRGRTFRRAATKTLRAAANKAAEEDAHRVTTNMADLVVTVKAVADHRGRSFTAKDSQRFGRSLKSKQTIPWYIIDPTGVLIKEQRAAASTRLQIESDADAGRFLWLSRRSTARCLARWPTLFPWWDSVTAIALIFTALVTPLEVGFFPPATSALDPLWIVNRIVDGAFVMDMVFQFFTMRPMPVEKTADSSIEWEMNLRAIARTYMCSFWFLVDVASIAPSGLEIAPMLVGSMDTACLLYTSPSPRDS